MKLQDSQSLEDKLTEDLRIMKKEFKNNLDSKNKIIAVQK